MPTHPSHRPVAAGLLAISLLLGGCGGGDDDAKGGSSTTAVPSVGETSGEGACSRLGDDEVTALLGTFPEPTLRTGEGSESSAAYSLCRWEVADTFIEVGIVAGEERYRGRLEYLDQAAEDGQGEEPTEVDDIGEEAYVVVTDNGSPQVNASARVDGETVEVNLGLAGEETPDQAVDLLAKVVARG